jgi:hypothetical protein
MFSEATAVGDDTAATCWLCDRERGELCHVHERPVDHDAEPAPVVVSLPEASEAAS